MISLPLKFDEVESVEEFVNMVKRLDYDVDVKIGRCVFDAKSLNHLKDFFDSDVVANDELLTKYLAKNKKAVLVRSLQRFRKNRI